MIKRPIPTAGFSLIEVALALAVAALLLPIVALLPIAQTTNQGTIRETSAVNLATALSNDLRATPLGVTTSPYYGLQIPKPGDNAVTNSMYISEDATRLSAPSTTEPTFVATVVLTPPAAAGLNATTARILLTWPAPAGQVNTSIPVHYQGSFETIIGIDRN